MSGAGVRPSTTIKALRALAVGLCLAALSSGCVSLLPTSEPAQLYRFGATAGAGVAAQPGLGVRTGVLLEGVVLSRAAVGDQILTVAGPQAAYLSGARWDAPASLLFNEAVQRGFDERAQRVRLNPRAGAGRTDASLRLFVRDFQADYGNVTFPPPAAKGKKPAPPPNLPPPTAVVALRARLTAPDGHLLAERDFTARRPAGENRVGAIVPALDAAVSQVIGELVAWTDASAPAPSAPPSGR